MPLFIDCVENDLTLGEICGVLRGCGASTSPRPGSELPISRAHDHVNRVMIREFY